MQTTLEIRWFLPGIPSATVQHWFKYKCPGQLITVETRKDLYAYGNLNDYLDKFKEFTQKYDRVNLKLREGDLELKLREEQFGVRTFTFSDNSSIWSGRVEQWCKMNLQQSKESVSKAHSNLNWIPVCKQRSQKSHRGVESELTLIEVEGSQWWSIAFEMTQTDNIQVGLFCEIVAQVALTYSGAELLAEDSYGYAHWLDKFIGR